MSWPLSQDYNEAIQDPRNSFSDAELKTGEAASNAMGIPMPRSGNFADVYELRCPSGSRWAVKCFTREVFGLRERYAEIGKYLRLAKLPFMVDFQYLEQGIRVRGQWYPILKMQWVEGFVLNEFVRDNLDKKPVLQALGQIWLRMARRLRESYIAHCDLQHGNVLFVPGSTSSSLAVKLIDYDGMCVPSLVGTKSGEVGHPAYQHPERLRTGAYDQEVDRFSLLSIATALRCLAIGGRSLWERYDTGDNLLFRQSDLQAPKQSPLFRELGSMGDAQAQMLVKELQRACQGRLDAVPLLTDLLPEAQTSAAPQRTTVARTSAAQARTQTAATESAWDFEGEEISRSRRRRKGGFLRWAGCAAAVGVVGLVLAGGIVALGLRTGSEKPEDEVRTAQNTRKNATPLVGKLRGSADAEKEQPDGDREPKEDAVPQPPATPSVPEPQEMRDPPNEKSADGFVPLFNGKDTTGWNVLMGNSNNPWTVTDGVLTSGAFCLGTNPLDYGDFHLRAETMLTNGEGAAIHICARLPNEGGTSYKVTINSARQERTSDTPRTGSLSRGHPGIVGGTPVLQVSQDASLKPAEWFLLEVIVTGNRVRVLVKGKVVVDYDDGQKMRTQGRIMLMKYGTTTVKFRKIEIKKLSSTAAPVASAPVPKNQPTASPPPPLDPKIRRAYKSSSGTWRIEGDELVQAAPVISAQLAFGDFTWKDYDLRVQVKASEDLGRVELRHHVTGRGKYRLSVGFGDKTNQFASCEELGNYTSLGNRPVGLRKDIWYSLHLRARGTHYQCFVNNTMAFEYDDTRNPKGAVGLYTQRTPVRFRNLRVTDPQGRVLFEGLPDLSGPPDQCFPNGEPASDAQLHCLQGHAALVNSVVFSRDGRSLVSSSSGVLGLWENSKYNRIGGPGGTVRLWDVESGKQLDCSPLAEPLKDNGGVYQLTRPTGSASILSTVDDLRSTRAGIQKIQLWTIADNKLQARLLFPQEIPFLRTFAVTPDHLRLVAISRNGEIWEWDLKSKKLTRHVPGNIRDGFGSGAIAPSGRLALFRRFQNKPFLELNLDTGKETGRWIGPANNVRLLVYAPDGRRVLSGEDDGKLRLWDVKTTRELPGFSGHQGAVTSLAFSTDGRSVLSGGVDGTVRLWSMATKKELARFTGHTGTVTDVIFSPDGHKAASAGADYTVRLWRLP